MCSRYRGPAVCGPATSAAAGEGLEGDVWKSTGVGDLPCISCIHFLDAKLPLDVSVT